MREQEPLEQWLFYVAMEKQKPGLPRGRGEKGKALQTLAQGIAEAPPGKIDFGKLRGMLISRYTSGNLAPAEAAEAQRLFLEIWERGGTGSRFVVEGLLEGIALARAPESIPFWKQLLDLSKPRDRGTTQRRTYALAALALLAIAEEDQQAYDALADALAHPNEQVRAQAAFYLAEAYAAPERPLPEHVEAALNGMAARDRAFTPRFQARSALGLLGRPVPADHPDSVYLLEVRLRGDKAVRTIAALAENTLSDLHYAIQSAYRWDADHLYSFYMNGVRFDERYEIGLPEYGDSWDLDFGSLVILNEKGELIVETGEPDADEEELADEIGEDEEDEDEDDDGERYATNTTLGELGLIPKHKFLYYFDFGDSHEFTVTVLKIETRAAGDENFPRLVEAKGPAPRQYASYEEEDELDEEEDELDDE
jgi:hypothetical protein